MALQHIFEDSDFHIETDLPPYKFICPVPLRLCHPDWVIKYRQYLLLENQQMSHLKTMESIKADF